MNTVILEVNPDTLDFCDYLPGDIAYLRAYPIEENYNDPVKILKIILVVPEKNIVSYLVKNLNSGHIFERRQVDLKKTKEEK